VADPKPKELTDCPDWGQGGSYIRDPKTGIRTLVSRTAPADDAPAPAVEPPAAAAAPADAVQTVKKGS